MLKIEIYKGLFFIFLKIFGMGQEWSGGNMKMSAGGGQKVNILVKELESYKNDQETILLFTDRYILLPKHTLFQTRLVFKNLSKTVEKILNYTSGDDFTVDYIYRNGRGWSPKNKAKTQKIDFFF